MRILLIILFLVFVPVLMIISNEKLAFYEIDNIFKFFGLYYGWFEGFYSNAIVITGNVIRMDWLPEKPIN